MVIVYINKSSILKFIITWLSAWIIDVGLLYILFDIFEISLYFAATISFIIANFYSFTINKFWTFKNKSKNHNTQFCKYFNISTIWLSLSLLFLKIFTSCFWIHYLFAKIIWDILVWIYNYLWYKFWTFKKDIC